MTPQTWVRVVVSPRRLLGKWRARGRAGRGVGNTFQRERNGRRWLGVRPSGRQGVEGQARGAAPREKNDKKRQKVVITGA